jgi:hypothetical protein
MNKQELAEQIAKAEELLYKHVAGDTGLFNNEVYCNFDKAAAAIVEAMGVQQDESQSADIKELKAWMNRLRSSNVQLFTKDVASGANVIVDEVIGWCNRKMQQGSSASAPAKAVEAMPDESINKEWSESSPVHAIILNEHIAYEVLWKCKKGHTNFQTILDKEGLQHDICLKCGKHYVYTVAKTLSVEAMPEKVDIQIAALNEAQKRYAELKSHNCEKDFIDIQKLAIEDFVDGAKWAVEAMDDKPNWKQLRDKFFKECTETYEAGKGLSVVRKVSYNNPERIFKKTKTGGVSYKEFKENLRKAQ